MIIETNVDLKPYNTFGLSALAPTLIRIHSVDDIAHIARHPVYASAPKLVLGGGSNLILGGKPPALVLKVEVMGRALVDETPQDWIVEAGAGEKWADLVRWTLDNGWDGLENLALIPGTVGAAPIQNIGAYGVEFRERFLSLECVSLTSGQPSTLNLETCRFGYRHSIFKETLANCCVVTHVRLRLPKVWRAVLDFPDLQQCCKEMNGVPPDARQVFEWVCALRRAKLPDPAMLGNAGSFFKNPVVAPEAYCALRAREPNLVGYTLGDGTVKLSAGWLIEACGWKGRNLGRAGVFERQALVVVNRGGATAQEILTLARAIQASVYARFGLRLEMEPVVV